MIQLLRMLGVLLTRKRVMLIAWENGLVRYMMRGRMTTREFGLAAAAFISDAEDKDTMDRLVNKAREVIHGG